MKALLIFLIILFVIVFVSLFFWLRLLGSVSNLKETKVFIVPQKQEGFNISEALFEQELIKNAEAFKFLLDNFAKYKEIKAGGYNLSQNMNSWQVLQKIMGSTDLNWVTISFCPRKEQVGEKLANALGWNNNQLVTWNNLYKNNQSEYFEGVYYPDTYLIPIMETPDQVAQRFINHFDEKFAPLADQFTAQNIKWTTGLKIASLIAREAAGTEDMKLISGIIWNRLNKNMALQIDATMQYTLGKNIKGSWWGNIDLDEKQSDSPYNSYRNKGLPPTPICSPNIDVIEAVLNPDVTDCLYYLHDSFQQIHCAVTYEEHKENIQKYL